MAFEKILFGVLLQLEMLVEYEKLQMGEIPTSHVQVDELKELMQLIHMQIIQPLQNDHIPSL